MLMATNPDATPAHYELAYDEARRALDAQESVVNELRTRSGVLIAAAAITTSFFGGRALSDGDVARSASSALMSKATRDRCRCRRSTATWPCT
jgi:hypothetical protein